MKTKKLDSKIAPKIGLSFYVTGFQDYLGARLLLNNGLLLQGATLASTAVEKHFKALLAGRNLQAFGHLSDWSPKELSKLTTEVNLNEDFFVLLQRIYKIRYLDNLEKPVSFTVERSKFLAELDHSIAILNRSVEFKRGAEVVNPYESDRQLGRQELIHENHIISGIDRKIFLTKPDLAEAFYIDTSLEIISCVVRGWVPNDLKHFTAPGIIRRGLAYDCTLLPPQA